MFHDNGEVLLGAFWKIRERFKKTDPTNGALAANVLHNAWLNAYDDWRINALLATHLLVADDRDANLENGTPHWADIDRAFVEQGFPPSMNGITFTNVTDLGAVADEVGPYTISATIVANFAPPITQATLHYRVNGMSWNQVAMTNTGGDTFSGSIPGQQAPAVVEHYLSAEDSTLVAAGIVGQMAEYPASITVTMDGTYDFEPMSYDPSEATPNYLRFHVGVKQVLFFDDFESGSPGWIEGGTLEDWELGDPAGLGDQSGQFINWSDPSNAYSGQNCRGNDLGLVDIDGAYEDNIDLWLQSPSIATPPAPPKVFLRFQRWLSVDHEVRNLFAGLTTADRAEISVVAGTAETPIWKNHRYIPHADSATASGSWRTFEAEISSAVLGSSDFRIEWALNTDVANPLRPPLGGWTIDDVEVFVIQPIP